MTNWLGNLLGVNALREQTEILKRELFDLRAELTQCLGRTAQQEQLIAELENHYAAAERERLRNVERLQELNDAQAATHKQLAEMADGVTQAQEKCEAINNACDTLRGAVARQEHQLQLHMEESARTWAAIVERVELARIAAVRSSKEAPAATS